MATISKSFTSVTTGGYLLVPKGGAFNYSVSGTFVATWVLEKTDDNGQSFQILATGTGAATAVRVEFPKAPVPATQVRFRCGAYTSGTMVTQMDNVASEPAISAVSGVQVANGQRTRFTGFPVTGLTVGTSTTPSATTVYLAQIYVPTNALITGFAVNNGGTVGTDKYIAALFDHAGFPLAYSAVAGTTTSGGDSYQALAFTAPYALKGPSVVWVGLYVNGTTDRFRSIPAAGAFAGLAGSATGQTFGTIAAVTLPTTFTADKGPVGYLY